MKTRKTNELLKCMIEIQKEVITAGYKVWSLVGDLEFDNKAIKSHFLHCKFYFKDTNNHTLTGIVERRNGFIRSVLQKYLTANKTLKWIDVIQQINSNINKTVNRTIKHTPYEVWTKVHRNDQDARQPPTEFSVGDQVRLWLNKDTFEKKSTGLYSTGVYTVEERSGLGYYLEGYTRKVFGWELKRVDTIERKIRTDEANNFPDVRKNNKRDNTIERRLIRENLY